MYNMNQKVKAVCGSQGEGVFFGAGGRWFKNGDAREVIQYTDYTLTYVVNYNQVRYQTLLRLSQSDWFLCPYNIVVEWIFLVFVFLCGGLN